MIRCANIYVLLADYADDTADARTRRIVERHVQLCQDCREEVLLARQIAQQMRRATLLPGGLAARVPRYQRRVEGQLLARQRARRRRPWLIAAALVLVVLELGTFWLLVYLAG